MLETKNEQTKSCPRCKSSQTVKAGKHYQQKGVVQRYRCKVCGTSFCNDGYYRGRHQLSLLQYVGGLYQTGLSSEKIEARLKKELGTRISRTSIMAWIEKLGIKPRKQSCGDQKNKTFRDLTEVGVVVTVRHADSFHPEHFMVLDNFVAVIGEMEAHE